MAIADLPADLPQVDFDRHDEEFKTFLKIVNITYLAREEAPFNVVARPEEVPAQIMGQLVCSPELEKLVRGKAAVAGVIRKLKS